jgi:hypothetical protein
MGCMNRFMIIHKTASTLKVEINYKSNKLIIVKKRICGSGIVFKKSLILNSLSFQIS